MKQMHRAMAAILGFFVVATMVIPPVLAENSGSSPPRKKETTCSRPASGPHFDCTSFEFCIEGPRLDPPTYSFSITGTSAGARYSATLVGSNASTYTHAGWLSRADWDRLLRNLESAHVWEVRYNDGSLCGTYLFSRRRFGFSIQDCRRENVGVTDTAEDLVIHAFKTSVVGQEALSLSRRAGLRNSLWTPLPESED